MLIILFYRILQLKCHFSLLLERINCFFEHKGLLTIICLIIVQVLNKSQLYLRSAYLFLTNAGYNFL